MPFGVHPVAIALHLFLMLGFTSFQQKAKNVLCLKVSQWNLGSCNLSLACFHYPPLSGVTTSVHLRLGINESPYRRFHQQPIQGVLRLSQAA